MSDPKYLKPTDFDFCLAHVVEECGEVLAAAGKTQRWGRASWNPDVPVEQRERNDVWLFREMRDLQGALVRLFEADGYRPVLASLPTPETLYPCAECGKMRTKAEGGTTFTVCDACWDRLHTKTPPPETWTTEEVREAAEEYAEEVTEWRSYDHHHTPTPDLPAILARVRKGRGT